ncbi:right-handed parallel beta-helix repeat-containing protein [Winogradskyella eckloniae]|uniref:right-handed parallel beta-helix repeat-containing protein n=1 Tax=Winogradskyella eckloniae TaxID=1089306 RepID=UPI0015645648|nr:right-handed parallel beta-helix repeat-containing protein [Winogradskyella eckloniae]NRD21191.1 right-handed parallel beta-helix repeat-containing protein [Winogradskyella eckloniae]
MKRLLSFLLCFGILIFWSSCRNDFEFSPNTGNLEFAKDTIYLDTVFSTIGSSTYNLKVYNRSDEDIVIPTIQLENGENSLYRMNVDGSTGIQNDNQIGKFFENVELLANDSLYIFIETTIDINSPELGVLENQFLYTDKILFDSGSIQQDVDVVTLVKDAVFIYPNRELNEEDNSYIVETLTFDVDGDGTPDETNLQGRFLQDSELTFTNEKPYVIYGYAGVGEGKTLTMEAGTRVHFHADSGIIVTDGASLNINGDLSTDQETLENEVILEGDRLEPLYSDIPGQWGTIWLYNGSINNTITYATIKNATIGLLAEGNQTAENDKLTISNSKIFNISSFGVLGRATSIKAENLVINNCGQSSFAGTFGGKYNLTHCTIANYWNSSFRQYPSLLINDYILEENGLPIINNATEANFINCIIYGNNDPEFSIENEGPTFNFKFTNCLLKFNDTNLEDSGNYEFNNTEHYVQNVFNLDPKFKNSLENELQIGTSSGANGKALQLTPHAGYDILHKPRNSTAPDCGAYESIVFED